MEIIFLNNIKTLRAELNPICRLLALLGAHHILHVSRIRVNWSSFITQRVWIYCDVQNDYVITI